MNKKACGKIGVMDRRVSLLQPVVARDGYGSENVTYQIVTSVWAMVEFRTLAIDEKNTAGFDLPISTVNFTLRYIQGLNITPKWRVIFDEQEYDIMHVMQEGRRERLILRAELRKVEN